MLTETERKFIVKALPRTHLSEPLQQDRYFLYENAEVELRIQRKNNVYELERKVKVSKLSRDTVKLYISEAEFDLLRNLAKSKLIRNTYVLDNNPKHTVKEYLETHKGLIRAEFEFDTEEEANNFVPPDWVGKEITHTDLGKDSRLTNLSEESFKKLLLEYS